MDDVSREFDVIVIHKSRISSKRVSPRFPPLKNMTVFTFFFAVKNNGTEKKDTFNTGPGCGRPSCCQSIFLLLWDGYGGTDVWKAARHFTKTCQPSITAGEGLFTNQAVGRSLTVSGIVKSCGVFLGNKKEVWLERRHKKIQWRYSASMAFAIRSKTVNRPTYRPSPTFPPFSRPTLPRSCDWLPLRKNSKALSRNVDQNHRMKKEVAN